MSLEGPAKRWHSKHLPGSITTFQALQEKFLRLFHRQEALRGHGDGVLDAVARHEVYSFLDGFSGCNQIRMHPDDQKKMACNISEDHNGNIW